MGRPCPSARTRTRPDSELPVTVAGDRRANHDYRGLWTPRRHRPGCHDHPTEAAGPGFLGPHAALKESRERRRVALEWRSPGQSGLLRPRSRPSSWECGLRLRLQALTLVSDSLLQRPHLPARSGNDSVRAGSLGVCGSGLVCVVRKIFVFIFVFKLRFGFSVGVGVAVGIRRCPFPFLLQDFERVLARTESGTRGDCAFGT